MQYEKRYFLNEHLYATEQHAIVKNEFGTWLTPLNKVLVCPHCGDAWGKVECRFDVLPEGKTTTKIGRWMAFNLPCAVCKPGDFDFLLDGTDRIDKRYESQLQLHDRKIIFLHLTRGLK